MEAFGEDFVQVSAGEESPVEAAGEDPFAVSDSTAHGSDPAADFLAKEQEELGELGLENPPEVSPVTDPSLDLAVGDQRTPDLTYKFTSATRLEEPETIRKWREEQELRLKAKDDEEREKLESLRQQAKKELSDWYKHYEEQLLLTKKTNRESEKEFVAEVNDIVPGTEWERINKLVDFNCKTAKSTRDLSRLRSIMLQLKQNPLANNSL